MQRLIKIFGAATLAGLVAACSINANDRTPAAAPAAPPVSAAPPAASAAPAPSSPVPSSREVEAAHTAPADLIIHPDHIGPLKIGMSLAAARATGLIVVGGRTDTGPESCVSGHWKGQSDEAWMIFNGRYGLRALDSFGNQQTPEGIRTGSTLAAVRQAYPHLKWRVDGDETPDARRTSGDAMVDAVHGDGAHYRITIQKGKVTDVQLESDRPGCYE